MTVTPDLLRQLEKAMGLLRICILTAKPCRNPLKLACDAFEFGAFPVQHGERFAECRTRTHARHGTAIRLRPAANASHRRARRRTSPIFPDSWVLNETSRDFLMVRGA